MRVALYGDPTIEEIDEWFAANAAGGTHAVGVAVFVVERGDGRLGGFAELGSRAYAEGCRSTPVAYLEGWYVDEDCRRLGIGKKLVAAVEAWAIENGFSELASDADINNTVSLDAHRALGFEEIERHVCLRKKLG